MFLHDIVQWNSWGWKGPNDYGQRYLNFLLTQALNFLRIQPKGLPLG